MKGKLYILTSFEADILRVLCHDALFVSWFGGSLNVDNRRICHLVLEREKKTEILFKIPTCSYTCIYAHTHSQNTLCLTSFSSCFKFCP